MNAPIELFPSTTFYVAFLSAEGCSGFGPTPGVARAACMAEFVELTEASEDPTMPDPLPTPTMVGLEARSWEDVHNLFRRHGEVYAPAVRPTADTTAGPTALRWFSPSDACPIPPRSLRVSSHRPQMRCSRMGDQLDDITGCVVHDVLRLEGDANPDEALSALVNWELFRLHVESMAAAVEAMDARFVEATGVRVVRSGGRDDLSA